MPNVQRVFYVGVSPTPIDPQTGYSAHWLKYESGSGQAPNFPVDGSYEVTEAAHPDFGVTFPVRISGIYGVSGRLFEFGEDFESEGYIRLYIAREEELGLGTLSVFDSSTSVNGSYEEAVLAANPEYFFRVDETTGTVATNIASGATQNLTYGEDISTYLVPTNTGTGAQIAGNELRNIYSEPGPFFEVYFDGNRDLVLEENNTFVHGYSDLISSGKDYLIWVKEHSGGGVANQLFFSPSITGNVYDYIDDAFLRTNTSTSGSMRNITDQTFDIYRPNNQTAGALHTGIRSAWTFQEDPDYFSILKYTGNGAISRDIPHQLNNVPRLIIFCRQGTLDQTVAWVDGSLIDSVFRVLSSTNNAQFNSGTAFSGSPDGTNVPLGSGFLNSSGEDYTAFVFAADGVNTAFGEYQGDTTPLTINCGFQPGFVIISPINLVDEFQTYHDRFRKADTGDNGSSTAFSDRPLGELDYDLIFTSNGFTVNNADPSHNTLNTYTWFAFRDPTV